MNFTWEHYLTAAKQLLTLTDSTISDEAFYRSSISRAYYAAHNTAHDWLIFNTGFSNAQHDNIHALVINTMFAQPTRDAKAVSRKLRQLRGLRVTADYDIPPTTPMNQRQAELVLHIAESTCSTLHTL